jgi:phospholipase A1
MVAKNRLSIYVIQVSFIIALCFLAFASKAQTDRLFRKDATRETMSQRWELDSASRKGTFNVTPYKPIYVTAGRWSSSPNVQPYSENPAYSLPFKVGYNNYEAKFQLSLKTKVFQNIFRTGGALWVGYTQKAHWQVYNTKLSRPFRELNYEPELILNFPVHFALLGFNLRMLGVSITHQSNGRTLPLSRSWNRVIFQAGLDRKNWQIYLRPWIRLHDEDDENPAIADYIGRGEAVVIYNVGRQQFSLIGTHTLRFDERNRGRIEANWVIPVIKNLRLQLKVANGYGETLIDYNHSQFTFGISVSLVEW